MSLASAVNPGLGTTVGQPLEGAVLTRTTTVRQRSATATQAVPPSAKQTEGDYYSLLAQAASNKSKWRLNTKEASVRAAEGFRALRKKEKALVIEPVQVPFQDAQIDQVEDLEIIA